MIQKPPTCWLRQRLHAATFLAALAGCVAVVPVKAVADPTPQTTVVTVVNERGEKVAIDEQAWAKLPRHKLEAADRDGQKRVWEGPLLGDVLKAAGVELGEELRGSRLMLYLVAEAADDYRVVFALSELDPTNTDAVVLLADRRDGAAMGDREGPLRIIVPHEKRRARWVRQVARLVVATAPKPAP